MRDPLSQEQAGDKQVLDTLLSILSQEEKAYGLPPSPELFTVVDIRGKNAPRPNNFNSRPSSSQPFRPTRDNNDPCNLARNGTGAKNWRCDIGGPPRVGSGRINPSTSGPAPKTRQGYDPPPRSSWRDLGNLKYTTRTGFPDIDFAVTDSAASSSSQSNGGNWRGQASKNYGPSPTNATGRGGGIASDRFLVTNSFRAPGVQSDSKTKNGTNHPRSTKSGGGGIVNVDHQKRNPKTSQPLIQQAKSTGASSYGKGPGGPSSQPIYSSVKKGRSELSYELGEPRMESERAP